MACPCRRSDRLEGAVRLPSCPLCQPAPFTSGSLRTRRCCRAPHLRRLYPQGHLDAPDHQGAEPGRYPRPGRARCMGCIVHWTHLTQRRLHRSDYYNRTESMQKRRHAGRPGRSLARAINGSPSWFLRSSTRRCSKRRGVSAATTRGGTCGVLNPGTSCCAGWSSVDAAAWACRATRCAGGNGTFHRTIIHNPLRAGGEHRRCPERNIRADELDTSVFEQIRNTLLRPKLLLAGVHAVSARREPVADELLQAQLAKLQDVKSTLRRPSAGVSPVFIKPLSSTATTYFAEARSSRIVHGA